MLVKFGYCLICDNGPDKKNRGWIEDLIKTGDATSHIIKQCTMCNTPTQNKNLLYIEVKITRIDGL